MYRPGWEYKEDNLGLRRKEKKKKKLSLSHNIKKPYLELVRLQFAVSCFASESRHIWADGGQSFDVGVKHYGRDEATGCAHGHTHIHHVIPGKHK